MSDENELPSKTCETCINDNLLKEVGIRKCVRCGELYCIHSASIIDGNEYCADCLSDLNLLKNEEVYARKDYDLVTDKEKIIRRRATTYKISGMDYLFMQRRNSAMSDAELELKIELFKEQTSLMILEREERKIKKFQAQNVKIGTVSSTVVTKTDTAVVSHTTMEKKKNQMNAILSNMKPTDALNMLDMLAKLMGKGK